LSRKKVDPPQFWIIAGPNGSGKSTLQENVLFKDSKRPFWIINPDLLAAQIQANEQSAEANLQAVMRIESWLETSIRAYQSVGVETVLSTAKYQRLVNLAKSFGYHLNLIYVILDSPERCVERVRLRIRKGGHRVPEEKVVARYRRSLEQLPWFLEAADSAMIFDNSGKSPKLIAKKDAGILTVDKDAPHCIVEVAKHIAG
jgi:predicted ABC-type ATPase